LCLSQYISNIFPMSATIKLPYDLQKLRPRPPWPLQRLKACLCLCHGARKLRRLEENLVTSGDAWVWKWMTPPSIVFSGRWSSTNRSWGTIFSDNPTSFSHLWLIAYTHILYTYYIYMHIYICVPAIIVSRWHCFLPPLEPGGEGKNAEGSQRDQAYQGGSGKFSLGLRESRNWKPRIFPWNISGGFRLIPHLPGEGC